MKRLFLFLVFCACGLLATAQHKSRKSFNKDWRFKLDSVQSYTDASVNDADWRILNLPHDWSIE